MLTRFVPSELVLREIFQVIDVHAKDVVPVRVYLEAEKIRARLKQNVALEDLVSAFITAGKSAGVVFEINAAHAAEAVMGTGCNETRWFGNTVTAPAHTKSPPV